MNRILITARKVRGVEPEALAGLLDVGLLDYQQLESSRAELLPEHARKLGTFYSLPSWYFLQAMRGANIDARIEQLRRQQEFVARPEYGSVPAGASVALAATIIELMKAKEELAHSLLRELELAEELAALTMMYEHVHQALESQSVAGAPEK